MSFWDGKESNLDQQFQALLKEQKEFPERFETKMIRKEDSKDLAGDLDTIENPDAESYMNKIDKLIKEQRTGKGDNTMQKIEMIIIKEQEQQDGKPKD